jgi:DnaJ-class molecular chaperone
MPDYMECPDCRGTGAKVEMRPLNFGHPIPPVTPCPRCGGTGKVPYPKPIMAWRRRKSMRRVTE